MISVQQGSPAEQGSRITGMRWNECCIHPQVTPYKYSNLSTGAGFINLFHPQYHKKEKGDSPTH